MTRLTIDYQNPNDLKPSPGNARTHSKKQLAQISASIAAFGFTNPVLIDEACEIIAGHGRVAAAKQLGLDSIPTITLTGLTAIQKRALRLADNKIALNAGWDLEVLKVELEAIADIEVEIDPSLTGFSAGEMEVILSEGAADPDDEVIPAVPSSAVTQEGDIWVLGQHRVACGDCRDHGLMSQLMAGAPADAAFLDPPYNVKIDGHAGGKGKIKHREFAFASGEMSPGAFVGFQTDTLGACAAVSRNGAVHFVCMDHRHLAEIILAGAEVYGARLNLCVWNKSNAGMGSLYRSKHELVFVFRVGDAPHFNAVELGRHGRNRTNVWDYASVNSFKGSRREDLALHPTVKPVGLVADAIQDVTRRGEVVLDAFLGSGTTLIAAERTGRRCRGLDIDPLYVDVALERWSAMTGGTPVLEATGQTFDEVRCERQGGEGGDQ